MIRLLLLGTALLAALAAPAGARAPAPARDLHGVDQLRAAFNAHAGVPRLIVIVSPT